MAEDRGPDVAAVLGLFLGLAWIFFSMRSYVKTFIRKSWGSDDLLLCVAILFYTAYCTSAAVGVKYGTGRHIVNIPPEDLPRALCAWWLCELFYTLSTLFCRFSIAVFLLRLCVIRIHKIIIYGSMAMILAYSIFYFFLVLFQCWPVSYFWNEYKGMKGSCINPAAVPDASIAHSAVSFSADWVLGLLPIALIWKLQMNRRTKVSVAAILGLGLLAGIATMIRVPYIKVLALTDDFLFATTDVAIWSTVEPGLGIVAASAITLRPLFRSLLPSSSADRTPDDKPSASPGGYVQTGSTTAYTRGSSRTAAGPDGGIALRDDLAKPDPVLVKYSRGKSRWADSSEEIGFARSGDEQQGGIQVWREVEVRSDEGTYEDSMASMRHSEWEMKRSSKDMV